MPDFTPEQIDAMPYGHHRRVKRCVTEEERANGVQGRFVEEIDRSVKMVVEAYNLDDPIAYPGTNGRPYTPVKMSDGSYNKVAMYI